jgi:hypothetical protein
MWATSREGVAARMSPAALKRTTARSSGFTVSASYSLGPIGACDTRDEEGPERGMGGRSIVARNRCGTGE